MPGKMANIEFLIAGNLCSLVFMVLTPISLGVCLSVSICMCLLWNVRGIVDFINIYTYYLYLHFIAHTVSRILSSTTTYYLDYKQFLLKILFFTSPGI